MLVYSQVAHVVLWSWWPGYPVGAANTCSAPSLEQILGYVKWKSYSCWIGFLKNLVLLLVKRCTEPSFPVPFSSETPSFWSGHSQSLFSPVRFIQLGVLRLETWSDTDHYNHSNPPLSDAIPWHLQCAQPIQFAESAEDWRLTLFAFMGICRLFFNKLSRLDTGDLWDFPAWNGTRTPKNSVCCKARASGLFVNPACWMSPTVVKTRQKNCCLLVSYNFSKKI